jgi:hypothetical protein
MKYRAAYLSREVTSPSSSHEDPRGTGFYCPRCGVLVGHDDLERIIAHEHPHARVEEAERFVQRPEARLH